MYINIDKVFSEITKRRQDKTLVSRVTDFLGGILPEGFPTNPVACLLRQMASCRFEDLAFIEQARRAGLDPFWPSYLKDRFSTVNPDKINYLRFSVKVRDNHHRKFKVVPIWEELDRQKPYLGAIETKYFNDSGQPILLHDLHHQMRSAVFPELAHAHTDFSNWYDYQISVRRPINGQLTRSASYYPAIFGLFVIHGVMFEDYHFGPNAGTLAKFVENKVQPAFDYVTKEVGLEPLVVQFSWQDGYDLYPKEVIPVLHPN